MHHDVSDVSFADIRYALHAADFNQAIWMAKRLITRQLNTFTLADVYALNTPSTKLRYAAYHVDLLARHDLITTVIGEREERDTFIMKEHVSTAVFEAESLWALKLLSTDVCLLPLKYDDVARKINMCAAITDDELHMLRFTEAHIRQLVDWELLTVCGHEDALHITRKAQQALAGPKQYELAYEDESLLARDSVHRLFL